MRARSSPRRSRTYALRSGSVSAADRRRAEGPKGAGPVPAAARRRSADRSEPRPRERISGASYWPIRQTYSVGVHRQDDPKQLQPRPVPSNPPASSGPSPGRHVMHNGRPPSQATPDCETSAGHAGVEEQAQTQSPFSPDAWHTQLSGTAGSAQASISEIGEVAMPVGVDWVQASSELATVSVSQKRSVIADLSSSLRHALDHRRVAKLCAVGVRWCA